MAERSGNKRIKAIYEARLQEKSASSIMLKPITGAHEASRQRFVKEKYLEMAYYSKSAHFEYINNEYSNYSLSTPGSLLGRRSSLVQFLKRKNKSSAGSVAEQTLSTAPESKASQSSVYPMETSSRVEHETSPYSTARSVVSNTIDRMPRRDSIGSLYSPVGNKKSGIQGNLSFAPPISGWDLANSPRDTSVSKAGPNYHEHSERGLSKMRANATQAAKGRRSSKGDVSVEANQPSSLIKAYEKYPDLPPGKAEISLSVQSSPKQLVKPKLVATQALSSPVKSRMSLYSKSSGTRGRSSSRKRDKDGTRECSTSRATRNRGGKCRDRSRGASEDAGRWPKDKSGRGKSENGASKSSTGLSNKSSRTSSLMKKIDRDQVSTSPQQLRSRSASWTRKKDSKASPSTQGKKSTSNKVGRSRSGSASGKETAVGVECSYSSKRKSSSGKKWAKDVKVLSACNRRERSRSSSSMRSHDKSIGSTDLQGSTCRSERTTSNRSRSKSTARSLEQLKISDRRRKNDAAQSVLTAPETSDSLAVSSRKKMGRRKNTVEDSAVCLKDCLTTDAVPIHGNFKGKTALSLVSSLSTNENTRSFETTSDILKEGEESFQVISTSSKRSNSSRRSDAKRQGSSRDGPPSAEYHVRGGIDTYENTRRRMGRNKVAEISAERSSRKNDILAALDREYETAGPLVCHVPSRSRSNDTMPRNCPLQMRAVPA